MISRRKFLSSFIVPGFGFLFSDSLYFEKFFVETNEFNIGIDKNGNSKVKIVQISDLHLRRVTRHHNKLAEQINSMSPDLLLFTGDIIEKEEDMDQLNNFLKLINHKIEKAAVMGNWERRNKIDLKRLGSTYRKNNCELLINQSKTFMFNGKKLVVTGIDDMIEGKPDFSAAVRKLNREENHIVLCHCPKYRDNIEKETKRINKKRPEDKRLKIDYVFAGHSHGGQVNIFGFTAFLPPGVGNYIRGWYKNSPPYLYVSKGIGTSVLPVRFGARAEIAVFNYYI
ncbi:MAG TPA: metallophosphoesterase [Nitrospirae bacterium]|nr:putative metallophosphoesterase [bacterium BMS3Abin06]HDH12535.1 metallophosphoesterase [Nitrospirota bacterium]HDZ00694.1 metallophosphoesterase [Nitrospirota bacterium]